MKKILFPTDFSEISKNAFVFALHLARSIHAEIITLHTYEFPQLNDIDMPVYLPEIYEVNELSNFENYKSHIPTLRKIAEQHQLAQIKMSNVLESGDLIENILEITKREHIDYVVMGTKGASGFTATFLGSVTEKVINATHAIVLAIPKDCHYKPIRRILFVTEYKTAEIEVLKRTLLLAKNFHAHVDCLYVKPPHFGIEDLIIQDWRKLFATEDVSFHMMHTNDAEGAVLEFIHGYQIDMLAMTTHHRSFFQRIFDVSLSKKLAFHSKIPILAMQA